MSGAVVTRLLPALWIALASGAPSTAFEDAFIERLRDAFELERIGNYVAAEKALVVLLKDSEAFGPTDERKALVLNSLGSVYHYMDNNMTSESCYRRALEIEKHLYGPNDPRTIQVTVNLAVLYLETKQTAKAERLGLEAILERPRLEARFDFVWATLLSAVAALEKLQGRFADAEKHQLEGLAICERLDPSGVETLRSLNNLGAIYSESGRSAEALPHYKRALAIAEKSLGPESPSLITLLANSAAVYYAVEGPDTAEKYFKRALSIGERTLGRDHSLVGQVMLYYSKMLEVSNRKAEAKGLRRRANSILEAAMMTDPSKHTVEYKQLVPSPSKTR